MSLLMDAIELNRASDGQTLAVLIEQNKPLPLATLANTAQPS